QCLKGLYRRAVVMVNFDGYIKQKKLIRIKHVFKKQLNLPNSTKSVTSLCLRFTTSESLCLPMSQRVISSATSFLRADEDNKMHNYEKILVISANNKPEI